MQAHAIANPPGVGTVGSPPPVSSHPSFPPPNIPSSTYRLQLRPSMTMAAVLESLDYLQELGVSHVYFSPYFKAVPGSTHGYDIVDFCEVDSEWGENGHRRLCEELRKRGLGHVLDMVPNHMGVQTQDNRYWWDVLRRGKSSPYARYFDVDWSLDPAGKIVLPVLSKDLHTALDAGLLRVIRDKRSSYVLSIGEHMFPINEEGRRFLLEHPVGQVTSDPASFQKLLNLQFYRLVSYKRGASSVNYRRFMDINGLAGIRVEDPEVFDAVHARLVDWVKEGLVDGIRIDHPDGLADPAGYFARLRGVAPHAWVVAEKILEPGQLLPETWEIDGTTGYEFMNAVGGLFVDPAAEVRLSSIYDVFLGEEKKTYEETVLECKGLALSQLLEAEVSRCADLAYRWGAMVGRDAKRSRLVDALFALTAALPVGRTYFARGSGSDHDVQILDRAWAAARATARECEGELDLIYAAFTEPGTGESSRVALDLVARIQQLTCAAAAKGVEDTALYRYSRLCSLNDLGCDPRKFSSSVDEFHELCAAVHTTRPTTMSTTSTHDTKRSEDVRLRIHALSEVPEEWGMLVQKCSKILGRASAAIDNETEYLLYQTMVGTWPIQEERLNNYAIKAVREAKAHTSWLNPDQAYEERVGNFIRVALADDEFRESINAFVALIDPIAQIHSLSQTALKMTAPGIPDVYQGTEVWDDSLVDPDNRRSVDFAHRRQLLRQLEELSIEQIWGRRSEGLPKLWIIREALRLRRLHPNYFDANAAYERLRVRGTEAQRVIAFSRSSKLLVVAPRLVGSLKEWGDTQVVLPEGEWFDVLSQQIVSGGETPVAQIFERFPVSMLVLNQENS